jgi:RNA polymerase sigma-70 factor (ECF subfamily)
MPPRFEDSVVPHLDAAFNYARWLAKNDAEAEDVVQDACVRALRFFSSLKDGDGRAWLMAIVRNTWYSRVGRRGEAGTAVDAVREEPADEALDPEGAAIRQQTVDRVREAVELLPTDFREAIVLRELEGCSYKEIASITGVPIGTVMSRLARARERLIVILRVAEAGEAAS